VDEPFTDAPVESERQLIERVNRSAAGVLVERVDDADAMRRFAVDLIAHTRREVCSTLPAGPYPLSMLMSSWASDTALLKAGVSVPVVYQSDAARAPEVLRYLTDFAAAGAKVRVARRVTHRTIIVDRQVVVVAVHPDVMGVPFLVVREPALVLNFREQFAALWRSAHSVGVEPEDSLANESVREILAILKSGVTDEVAARQLGVSDRTIRRRVAAVLDLLGASSRFEAGVKAVESGWI
jgi:DNA-binding CsgD family transcriptional regulator